MSKHTQDMAKLQVQQEFREKYGVDLFDIPGVNGIGIEEGAVVITTAFDHPDQQLIPAELGYGFSGCPVNVRYIGEPEPIQGRQQQRGSDSGSGLVQGGIKLSKQGGGYGTCFGVLVDNQGGKYACTSSHVMGIGSTAMANGKAVGKVTKDARLPCNGNVYVDIIGALLNQGVQSSFNIIGLGTPKGFEKPAVGMAIHSDGQNSGKVDQKVKTINFSIRNDTGRNCPVNFQDCWIGTVRSRPGESGSAFWNDKGNIVGICTTNVSQGSMNCSVWHIPGAIGLYVPGTEGQQQQPQPQQRRGRGYSFILPSIA